MDRRLALRRAGALAGLAVLGGAAGRVRAQQTGHEHHHHAPGRAGPGAGARYQSLVAPFQHCNAALTACIAHCQVLLATGDKSLGECLRTALDCDVVCGATLRAALLNSDFTKPLAQTAIPAMDRCAQACKPHVEHHAECKACYESCLAAIDAARTLG